MINKNAKRIIDATAIIMSFISALMIFIGISINAFSIIIIGSIFMTAGFITHLMIYSPTSTS